MEPETIFHYYVALATDDGFQAGFYESPHELDTSEAVKQMVSDLSETYGTPVVPLNWKRLLN